MLVAKPCCVCVAPVDGPEVRMWDREYEASARFQEILNRPKKARQVGRGTQNHVCYDMGKRLRLAIARVLLDARTYIGYVGFIVKATRDVDAGGTDVDADNLRCRSREVLR